MVEITATEQNTEKKDWKKKKRQPRYLWGNIKYTNIHIIGVPEGEETWENTWRDNSWKLP